MLKIDIKAKDAVKLRTELYTQVHPHIMKKYLALHLKQCGMSNKLICNVLGICNNTLLSYFKEYIEGGLEKLQGLNFYCPQSDLQKFSGDILRYFDKNPPSSISEAAAKIEELTGVKRGETQVRKFLKHKGFRFRTVGTVPAKALTEEKKTSRENFWKRS
jgi:transposase